VNTPVPLQVRKTNKGRFERRVNRFLKSRLPLLHRTLRAGRLKMKEMYLKPIVAQRHERGEAQQDRAHVGYLLQHLNLNGEGVETGVLTGYFSELLLMNSTLSVLHSVDPWKNFDDASYHDVSNVDPDEQERNYRGTMDRLKKYGSRSHIMRMTSQEAAKEFPDGSLDFVYIDANHSYQACKEDIELWWPKVKKGGILAGHDYLDGEIPEGTFGVKSAVDEFLRSHPRTLYVTPEKWPTWYFVV